MRELRPWLFRIAHNAALNALRAERSRGEHVALDGAPGAAAPRYASSWSSAGEPDLDDAVLARDLLASMRSLPQMQREAIVRAAIRGESYEEVAGALGLSDGAVRGLLHRARSTVRAAVAALAPPPLILAATSGLRRLSGAGGLGNGAGGAAGIAAVASRGGLAALAAGAAVASAVIVPGGGADHGGKGRAGAGPGPAVARSAARAADDVARPGALAPTSSGRAAHRSGIVSRGDHARRAVRRIVSSDTTSGKARPGAGESTPGGLRQNAAGPASEPSGADGPGAASSSPGETALRRGSSSPGSGEATTAPSGVSGESRGGVVGGSGFGGSEGSAGSGTSLRVETTPAGEANVLAAAAHVASVEASVAPASGSVSASVGTPIASASAGVDASTGTVSASIALGSGSGGSGSGPAGSSPSGPSGSGASGSGGEPSTGLSVKASVPEVVGAAGELLGGVLH